MELQMAAPQSSLDVGDRCSAEFTAIINKHRGDIMSIKNKCSYVIDTIISCYQGSCEQCKQHSYVCDGQDAKWGRPYLSSSPKYRSCAAFINPNEEDKNVLMKCLNRRSSQGAVDMTFLNTDQNKCEAANRGLSKGVPKHIMFPRNYTGRVHACVHSMNNGPGIGWVPASPHTRGGVGQRQGTSQGPGTS